MTGTIYAVLDEDRGGDTKVTLHRNYKSAKKEFDQRVEIWKECFDKTELKDLERWDLKDNHLRYDMDSSWGNVAIITEGDEKWM